MMNLLLVRPDVPTVNVRRLQWLGLVMVLASVLAWAMTPTKPWAGRVVAARYESFFPSEFGDWQLAREQATAVVNPQQQETLDAIYDEVVSKVYVQRSSGRRVMVSLAYGNNQSRATQVHKPEVCYPAQGFELMSMRKDLLQTSQPTPLPVMRVVAKMGRRVEPLTYWIRAGDRVVRGAIEQNLARISLGLRGYIPDGLLFRVSEINPDATSSFALQDRFVSDFLAQLPAGRLQAFVGTPLLP